MRIDIWSDVVCPWCYIGKRRFETALAGFAHRDQVEVVWHAFELDPTSTASKRPGTQAEHLAGKYGMSIAQAQTKLDEMTELAALEGLEYHFELTQGGKTIDAHRLIHHALTVGGPELQGAMKERLLKAVFTEGAAVYDRGVLAGLAAEVGIEGAAELLETAADVAEVEADIAQAHAFGITGVPFFVFDNRYGVAGAQPAEVLLQGLEQAWANHAPTLVSIGADGQACGPDGCPV